MKNSNISTKLKLLNKTKQELLLMIHNIKISCEDFKEEYRSTSRIQPQGRKRETLSEGQNSRKSSLWSVFLTTWQCILSAELTSQWVYSFFFELTTTEGRKNHCHPLCQQLNAKRNELSYRQNSTLI